MQDVLFRTAQRFDGLLIGFARSKYLNLKLLFFQDRINSRYFLFCARQIIGIIPLRATIFGGGYYHTFDGCAIANISVKSGFLVFNGRSIHRQLAGRGQTHQIVFLCHCMGCVVRQVLYRNLVQNTRRSKEYHFALADIWHSFLPNKFG